MTTAVEIAEQLTPLGAVYAFAYICSIVDNDGKVDIQTIHDAVDSALTKGY